jgi:hypothetical protein
MSLRSSRRVFLLALAGGAAVAFAEGAPPPAAGCRWDQVARRSAGSFPGTRRWDAGSLAVKDGKVVWADGRDPGRNVIVPLGKVTGQYLECDSGPEPAPCSAWGFRTKREEYVFRDLVSGRAGSLRLVEIRDYVRSAVPGLPETVHRTDRR